MLDPKFRTGKHRYQRWPILQPKTVARQVADKDLFYIGQTRAAEIGVHPKYRNGICFVTREAWEKRAAQWDADHDVARPAKPKNRKSRKRDKIPRPASTYRAARRNSMRTGVNGGMRAGPTPPAQLIRRKP